MPGLPELDIARVRRWCGQRVPEHARDQVRVECDIGPRHLTIVECRPPWRQGIGPEWTRFPIARLRYTQATNMWTLYWRDRNLRFHRYDQLEPSPDISVLLREIERDPKVLIAGQPTRGLDVGAIEFVHRRLVEERDEGRAILLVSLELDEILSLSDRILVVYEGEVVGEHAGAVSEEAIGLEMLGGRTKSAA